VNSTLLQTERERVATREELLHVKEDLCKMTVCQGRLRDRLQRTDDMLTVRAHLLGCERNKVKDLAWLTCTAFYLRDKAERLRMIWEDVDSFRVDELMELNGELPFKSQRAICTETFKLHLCPMAQLPTPVETQEMRVAHALVSRIFPSDYPTEDYCPVSYKRARTE
jgi:hypothetical protein